MKTLTHKLLAFTFVIALASGCASVTDAGITPDEQPTVEQPAPDANNPGFSSDYEMGTIVDKPE